MPINLEIDIFSRYNLDMSRLKEDIYNLRFAFIIIIIYVFIMQIVFGTVCPLKAFTGIFCPACGLTHASIYMFMGDFKKSLETNPTAFFWIMSIVLFVVDRYVHKMKFRVFSNLFVVSAIISVVWYLYSMVHNYI